MTVRATEPAAGVNCCTAGPGPSAFSRVRPIGRRRWCAVTIPRRRDSRRWNVPPFRRCNGQCRGVEDRHSCGQEGRGGKTTIAYELAYLLNAPFIVLEFDGSATRMWGYRHEERLKVPLLDALEGDRPATTQRIPQNALLPCHSDFH